MGYDRDDCWMTCGERDDKCAGLGISDPFADIDRLTRELAEARAERSESDFLMIARLQREVARLRAALGWAFGQMPDADGKWFGEVMPEQKDGERLPPYWWRKPLRKLAGLTTYVYDKDRRTLVEQSAHDPRDDFSKENNPFPGIDAEQNGEQACHDHSRK